MGAADGSAEPQLYYAVVEDAARLRDGLGIMPAAALPTALLEPVAEPLEDLVSRYARTHIPFTAQQAAEHFSRLTPVGVGVLTPVLQRLQQQRRLSSGEFLPEVLRALRSAGVEWVDAQVLRTIRARSLAALREEIEPVSAQVYGVFLPSWQNVRSLSVRVAQTLPEASAYGAFIPSRRAATVMGERVAPLSTAAPNPLAEHGAEHTGQDSASATEDLLTAIDQLAGVRVPASALETLILPARVPGYQPHMLDELMASGRVFFTGAGQLGGGSAQKSDGWIRLHLSESSSLTLGEDYPEQLLRAENPELWEALQAPGTLEHAIYEALAHGGLFVPALRERVAQLMSAAAPAGQVVTFPDAAEVSAALWRLVWAGAVTNDSFAPVRAMLAGVRSAHPTPAAPARLTRVGRRGAGRIAAARASMGNAMAGGYGADSYRSSGYSVPAAGRGLRSLRGGLHGAAPAVAPQDSGRFSRVDTLLQEPVEATVAALARADLLLDRYGVLTRGCLQVEDSAGGFSQLYRIYSAAEDRALVRRGYFIEGLGAAQFAAPATVDLLRSTADSLSVPAGPQGFGATQGFGASAYTPQRTDTERVYGTFTVTLLAATDPANPYGAALSWPAIPSFAHEGTVKHRPARKAGACVVLVDGAPVLYVERGAKTLLAFTTDPILLEAAAPALARLVSAGGAEKISVEKVNDVELLGTHTLSASGSEIVEHPVEALRAALQAQGFYATVRGLSLRRSI